MSLTAFGNDTKKTLFLKGPESHKLHQEFVVAAGQTVKKGQPVTLNTDGEVVPAGANAASRTIIGYSVHTGAAAEYVTVAMKAYALVWAMPNAAVNAGPVAYDGLNTTDNDYSSFKAAAGTAGASTAEEVTGWALDKATAADEPIRVALV